jgi:hypothetical protein
MRISKQLRDDAATICAVVASDPSGRGQKTDAADSLGLLDYIALDLAFDAVDFVYRLTRSDYGPDHGPDRPLVHAEAEALLRTGWTP